MVLSESKRCFPDQTKTPRKNTASRPSSETEFYTSDPTANRSQPGPQGPRARRGTRTPPAGPTRHPLLPIPLGTFHSPPSLPFRYQAGAAYPSRCAPTTTSTAPLYIIPDRLAHTRRTRRPTRRNRATQTHTRRCLRRRAAPARSFSTQVQSGYGRRGLRRRTVLAQAERGRRGARDRG